MNYFKVPKFLIEVFGERQTLLEVACTLIFAVLGSWIIFSGVNIEVASWKMILAFLLIADVLAGCIANFTFGTNEYYSSRPGSRLTFIAIHVHLLLIAWLLSQPIETALIVWGYTIASAFLVNALKGKVIQRFIAANLMCYGIMLLVYLKLPAWFFIVSVFFMIKVMYSFSVDHFAKGARN